MASGDRLPLLAISHLPAGYSVMVPSGTFLSCGQLVMAFWPFLHVYILCLWPQSSSHHPCQSFQKLFPWQSSMSSSLWDVL